MGNLTGFKADQYESSGGGGYELLQPGEYEVVIIDSEMKPTKAGTGKYLELTLEVISGPATGRKLWERLNIHNPSAKAQEIARGTLSAICRAVDVLTPGDSADLHNRPMLAAVKIKRDAGYGDKNEITGYRAAKKSANPLKSTAQVPSQDDEIPF